MAKVRMVIGIVLALVSGIGAYRLYLWVNEIYNGGNPLNNSDYTVQLYFFGWIGYAIAAALVIIALYFIYYFFQGLYDTLKGR